VNWLDVYEYAVQNLQPESGTYHDNYIVTDPPSDACLVRVPRYLASADPEPRMYTEPAALTAVSSVPVAQSPHGHGGLRYLSVLDLGDGHERWYYELTRADGAHEIRTELH